MEPGHLLTRNIDSVTMLALVRLCDNASQSHFAMLPSHRFFATTPLRSAALLNC
jgi:hypothetical protein